MAESKNWDGPRPLDPRRLWMNPRHCSLSYLHRWSWNLLWLWLCPVTYFLFHRSHIDYFKEPELLSVWISKDCRTLKSHAIFYIVMLTLSWGVLKLDWVHFVLWYGYVTIGDREWDVVIWMRNIPHSLGHLSIYCLHCLDGVRTCGLAGGNMPLGVGFDSLRPCPP